MDLHQNAGRTRTSDGFECPAEPARRTDTASQPNGLGPIPLLQTSPVSSTPCNLLRPKVPVSAWRKSRQRPSSAPPPSIQAKPAVEQRDDLASRSSRASLLGSASFCFTLERQHY